MKRQSPSTTFPAIDALAALAPDGSLLISVVHRGSAGPIRLATELCDFDAASRAEIRTLSADTPWAVNTIESPEAIRPADTSAEVREGNLTLELRPFTVLRVRIPKKR
jgi:alpha-L-arabinofuranosidase